MSDYNWPPFQAGDTVELRKDYSSNYRKGHRCKVLKVAVAEWAVDNGSRGWVCVIDMTRDRSPWAASWFVKRRK